MALSDQQVIFFIQAVQKVSSQMVANTSNVKPGGDIFEELKSVLDSVLSDSGGGSGVVSDVFGRSGVITAQAGDYNSAQITENSANLFFTQARSIASLLTGFTSGAGLVTATDTVLQAIQKLDGNIQKLDKPFDIKVGEVASGAFDDSANLPAADDREYLLITFTGKLTLGGVEYNVNRGDILVCNTDSTVANTPANWEVERMSPEVSRHASQMALSLHDYIITSDFRFLSTQNQEVEFSSDIIVYDLVTMEETFRYDMSNIDLDGYKNFGAVVLWFNNGATQDLWITAHSGLDISTPNRLYKLSNVTINLVDEVIEFSSKQFIDLPSVYFYQHIDQNYIWYNDNTPDVMTRVNLRGKLESIEFNMDAPLPSSGDTTYIKGNNDCIWINRFGESSQAFKSDIVMFNKANPTLSKVIATEVDEPTGYATTIEVDYNNGFLFCSLVNVVGPGLANASTAIIIKKYHLYKDDPDTGLRQLISRTEVPFLANVDDGGAPYLGRTRNMWVHNNKLYCIIDRNPQLFVFDILTMSLLHSSYLGTTTDGLITDPDNQREGGNRETGWVRWIPYKVYGNKGILSVMSDTFKVAVLNLDTYAIEKVTDVRGELNYITALTDKNDYDYPDLQRAAFEAINDITPKDIDPTTVNTVGSNDGIDFPATTNVIAYEIVNSITNEVNTSNYTIRKTATRIEVVDGLDDDDQLLIKTI